MAVSGRPKQKGSTRTAGFGTLARKSRWLLGWKLRLVFAPWHRRQATAVANPDAECGCAFKPTVWSLAFDSIWWVFDDGCSWKANENSELSHAARDTRFDHGAVPSPPENS